MASHGIHHDVEAVLCAGCHECEWRAGNLPVALAHMEPETIERAWRRALASHREELVPNAAERPLLQVIHTFALLLSQRNVLPYGQAPGDAKPGFRLTLELGNASMTDDLDVSIALQDVVLDLRTGYTQGLVMDRDGNAVGAWSLTLPADASAGKEQ